jgi:hypothetical protein
VRPGDARTSADEADVTVTITAGDVRERTTLEDHTGNLTAHVSLRITDRGSGTLPGGGDEPATVTDMPLDIPVQCAATPGGAGGTCSTSTTVDALIPGAVAEGQRAIWEFGQVELLGPDERPFMRQGVFAP